MTRTLTIEIPGHPPKLLSRNGGDYHNPNYVRAVKHKWQEQVAWAIKAALKGQTWETLERAELTVIRVIDGVMTRRMDDDNLTDYFKATRDVLKPNGKTCPYGMGIIRGDEPGRLKTEYMEEVDKARAPMTVIKIKEG